jgi:hypothetical protein
MMIRSVLMGISIVLAVGSTAKAADILAGGGIYGGHTQTTATCYLFNAGNSAVSISSLLIYNDSGGATTVDAGNCGTKLGARKQCFVFSGILNTSYACRAIVASKTNLRGNLQIRNVDGVVLINVELR